MHKTAPEQATSPKTKSGQPLQAEAIGADRNILLTLFLLAIPLKLSIAYLLLALLLFSSVRKGCFKNLNSAGVLRHPIVSSWLIFVGVLLVTALLNSYDRVESVKEILKLLLYSSSALVFLASLKSGRSVFLCLIPLIIGQAIAGAHSLLQFLAPENISQLFVGTVSESGQITLTLILAIALAFYFSRSRPKLFWITLCATCLIALAVICNLKRGPLLGIFIGLSLFFYQSRQRKALLGLIAVILLAVIFTPSLQLRILQAVEHFYIEGGRADIWELGLFFTRIEPLGIGFGNSGIIPEYSSYIPDNLRHFHNNLLNVWVESGMIGMVAFLFFVWRLLSTPISKGLSTGSESSAERNLFLAAKCSIVAWFFAGLVEYNFADSEIMLIFYFVVAVIMYLSLSEHPENSSAVNPNRSY